MKIIYKLGDLLNHSGKFILHGCNAQGVMGSGVARAIRDQYPDCYKIYRQQYEKQGLVLGQVVVADCQRFVFFNAITQEYYGGDGRKYLNDNAIVQAIKTCNSLLAEISHDSPVLELALPLIGAGLAGGDWVTISHSIEKYSQNFQPIVYIPDQNKLNEILAALEPGQ